MKRALIGLLAWAAIATVAEAQTVGTCSPALSDAYLDVGNVRARLLNNGNLFYKGEPHVYNVPKGSSSNALFNGGFWMAGMVNGTLRAAASPYGPYDYWPGPLDEAGNPPADCAEYDRIYVVSRSDVSAYEATGVARPDLADWPTGLGAPTVDASGITMDLTDLPLAQRKSRVIDLSAGERPALIGDQAAWWVMNDMGNVHGGSKSDPLGIEVRVQAFAFDEPGHVGNATFYRYTIVKKGPDTISDAYLGLFSDPDLGDFSDDWVGSDTLLSLGFGWNSDNTDGGSEGYGTPPPAVGYDLFQGPIVPSPGDRARVGTQVIDGYRNLEMTAFVAFPDDPPWTAELQYESLRGIGYRGHTICEGGNGWCESNYVRRTTFMFPGDAANCAYWSECRASAEGWKIGPGDRRFLVASGPFAMAPGETQHILWGIVYARGRDNFDSVRELKAADEALQRFVDSGFTEWPEAPQAPAAMPSLLSPADGVAGQPVRLRLHWTCPVDLIQCGVQLAPDPDFRSPMIVPAITSGSDYVFALEPDRTYWWRARGFGPNDVPGPWSEVRTFSTGSDDLAGRILDFQVVANAAGPLDPPECGAFDIGGSGFPLLSCGKSQPDGSRQQSGGVLTATQGWGLHAGGAAAAFGSISESVTYMGRSGRGATDVKLAPYDYEIRFTAAGGKARKEYQDGADMDVPFEVWRTGLGTPGDPSDDVRLIPFVNDFNTTGLFDIGGDHAISPGADDPFSDWIYFQLPEDDSPGQAGYEAYFAGTGAEPTELWARQVLVCVDCGAGPPYPQPLPEVGTIFRIRTGVSAAAILAAPAPGSEVPAGAVRLYWSAPSSVDAVIQVAATSGFSGEVETLTGVLSGRDVTFDEPGVWWWRVGNEAVGWSEAWSLHVLLATAVESGGELPTEYALDAIWPNPFNPLATIRFGLPSDAVATVDVVDVLGRRVAVIDAGARRAAGWHTVQFDGSRLASGVYFVRLAAGGRLDVKSVVLLK